jgi:hypothetical protein
MQLYDITDSFGSFSETELLSFASKSWPTEIGRFFFIKGRKDSTCANINNTNGAFVKGFGSCNVLQRSLCQFLQISRETFYIFLKHQTKIVFFSSRKTSRANQSTFLFMHFLWRYL